MVEPVTSVRGPQRVSFAVEVLAEELRAVHVVTQVAPNGIVAAIGIGNGYKVALGVGRVADWHWRRGVGAPLCKGSSVDQDGYHH